MCEKAITEIDGTLNSVSECYKNKKCVIKLLIIMHMH